MDRLHRLAIAISRAGTLVGGGLLLLSAVLVAIDVTMRAFLSRSIGGADELSGYALTIATAWGLCFALLERSHIRIDTVYKLTSAPLRAAMDLLSLIGFFVFMSVTTYYAWIVLSQSITSNARSISGLSTPLAIPQALWFAGFVFLLAVIALLIVEGVVAMLRGDLASVARLIGSKAVTEEIDEEMSGRGRGPLETIQ